MLFGVSANKYSFGRYTSNLYKAMLIYRLKYKVLFEMTSPNV